MVTGRELLWDISRIAVRIIAWLIGLPLLLLTILRFLAEDQLWLVGMWTTFAPYCFVAALPIWLITIVFRTWRSSLLLLVTLIAGSIWLGPVLLRQSAAAPAVDGGTALRVVTYTPDRAYAVYDDFRQWIAQAGADIVVVQDFRLMNGRGLLDRLAADFPHISWKLPAWRPTSGNLMLSRYPILEQSVAVEGGDAAGSTFVTRVLLEVNGQVMAVYNVDLVRSYRPDQPRFVLNGLDPIVNRYMTGYDSTARNAALYRLLEQLAQETHPYVVVGNFGFTPMHTAYGRLAAVMNDSQHESGYGMAPNWPLDLGGGIPPLAQFDYVWHSPVHWQTVTVFLGPHLESRRLPLVADLRLLPAAPPN